MAQYFVRFGAIIPSDEMSDFKGLSSVGSEQATHQIFRAEKRVIASVSRRPNLLYDILGYLIDSLARHFATGPDDLQ